MSADQRDENELLRTAYDPERFRKQGHAVVDLLADYLAGALAGTGPVLPWVSPDTQRQRFCDALDGGQPADLVDVLREVVERANHLHHPRYVGHQVPPPLPDAALAELVSALLNNSVAVYEMSPAATAIEHAVMRWMARVLGFGSAASGMLTSGGSLGNLTGLLAARRALGAAGVDIWEHGSAGTQPLALIASAQGHYSIARAAHVLGLGREGIYTVDVDRACRLRVDKLEQAVDRAQADGRRVLCVVASAGTTATGTYDPLEAIATVCAQRGLWLHVDAAHGGAAALSSTYRHLVAGIERADSVVWDAHKLLLAPSLVTGVLFKDGVHASATFSQDASYLFGASAEEEWFNMSHRTLECTKSAMAVKVYAALMVHGEALFARYVTAAYDLSRSFAALIREQPDFELFTEPMSNIVCFRHVPAGNALDEPSLDALQPALRTRLCASGHAYLVQTRLCGHTYLRTTLMNPFTTLESLAQLLEELRSAARAAT